MNKKIMILCMLILFGACEEKNLEPEYSLKDTDPEEQLDKIMSSAMPKVKSGNFTEINYRLISPADIPENVRPIQINNDEELSKLLQELSSEVRVFNSNELVQNSLIANKTRTEGPGSVSTVSAIDVLVTCSWDEIGGPITVFTTNYSTWTFKEWVHNTGNASWANNNTRINYSYTGTIIYYVYMGSMYVEFKREHKTGDGYINL